MLLVSSASSWFMLQIVFIGIFAREWNVLTYMIWYPEFLFHFKSWHWMGIRFMLSSIWMDSRVEFLMHFCSLIFYKIACTKIHIKSLSIPPSRNLLSAFDQSCTCGKRMILLHFEICSCSHSFYTFTTWLILKLSTMDTDEFGDVTSNFSMCNIGPKKILTAKWPLSIMGWNIFSAPLWEIYIIELLTVRWSQVTAGAFELLGQIHLFLLIFHACLYELHKSKCFGGRKVQTLFVLHFNV